MIHWLMEKMGLEHCPECSTLVDFAMDGLEDGQRRRVRKHLTECPPCMEQVRDFLQVNEGLGLTVPETDCPQGFEQRVLQRLKEQDRRRALDAPLAPSLGGWPLFWLRIGPVFAALSLIMTLVAFGALWHSSGSAAVPNDLAQMSNSLLSDPKAVRVTLVDAKATSMGGELVLCRGMKNIYLRARGLEPCPAGTAYVLWLKPDGAAASQKMAAFIVQAEGEQFQLLQLPRALDASGPVKFMLTEEPLSNGSKEPGREWMSGSVTL